MLLELSEKDAQLLREVLASYLKELRGEIVDTDNHEYKKVLRREREQLDSIVVRLEHASTRVSTTHERVAEVTDVFEMSGLD
jgi:hypothetical protein